MAQIIILKSATTFILEMTDEDLERLACISSAKNKNYFDVVLACFHSGLVTLTNHCKCHSCRRPNHDNEKNQEDK